MSRLGFLLIHTVSLMSPYSSITGPGPQVPSALGGAVAPRRPQVGRPTVVFAQEPGSFGGGAPLCCPDDGGWARGERLVGMWTSVILSLVGVVSASPVAAPSRDRGLERVHPPSCPIYSGAELCSHWGRGTARGSSGHPSKADCCLCLVPPDWASPDHAGSGHWAGSPPCASANRTRGWAQGQGLPPQTPLRRPRARVPDVPG